MIQDVTKVINQAFPGLVRSAEVVLSAISTLVFDDLPFCVAVILVGPPGSGKTEPLTWCCGEGTKGMVIRVDDFTPASFVSHAANIPKKKLEEEIDLLPKLKDKVLITKELGPVWKGKADDVAKRLGVMASVLDGHGYQSSSGSQGTRGYPDEHRFSWIGASTPIPPLVLTLMGNLGPRLLFFNTRRPRKSKEELMVLANQEGSKDRSEKCTEAVRAFLMDFFESHPVRSLSGSSITIPGPELERLVVATQALTLIRASMNIIGEPDPEYEERPLILLQAMARGRALIYGRQEVDKEDMRMVRSLALSSGSDGLFLVMNALINNGGAATEGDLVKATGLTAPTVSKYAKDASTRKLLTLSKGGAVTLASDYEMLVF